MLQSSLFGHLSDSLAQVLGSDWRLERMESYNPFSVFVHEKTRSWVEIRQVYFLDNGDAQIACKCASAEIMFVGSEIEGCKAYSLFELGEPPAPYKDCTTLTDVKNVMHQFVCMDTTKKRKASRMDE